MKWTDSDNLHSRDALVVGGPHDGLRIAVNVRRSGDHVHPDVVDLTGYAFNREAWTFELVAA